MIVKKAVLEKAKKDAYQKDNGIWSTSLYGGLFCDSHSAIVYSCMCQLNLLKSDDFVLAIADVVEHDIATLEGGHNNG